jgi:arylsulfatase
MDAPFYPLYAGQKLWTVLPAAYLLQMHAETFKQFPPRQAPANFSAEDMLASVLHAAARGVGNS